MIPKVTSFDALSGQYDAFFIDVFGVLLDGQNAYPGAPETLARLSAAGKRVILLSNSGKRAGANIDRLVAHGFARDSFEDLLSSGEVAYKYLSREIGRSIAPNPKVWLVSRGGDMTAINGLPVRIADTPDQADLVFLAGCDNDRVSLEIYVEMLRGAAARGVACLCSNPDLLAASPGGAQYGTGRIAQAYADMGGQVHWIGKPHPLMYQAGYELLGHPPRARILCIGDSPSHDILGGQQAGFATALVRTGIHAGLDEAAISRICDAAGAMPDYTLAAFLFGTKGGAA